MNYREYEPQDDTPNEDWQDCPEAYERTHLDDMTPAMPQSLLDAQDISVTVRITSETPLGLEFYVKLLTALVAVQNETNTEIGDLTMQNNDCDCEDCEDDSTERFYEITSSDSPTTELCEMLGHDLVTNDTETICITCA